MNIPLPEETLARIKDCLFRGQRIEAIKLYRESTGAGLTDAVTVMDDLDAELHATSPEKLSSQSFSRGRSSPSKDSRPDNFGCCLLFGILFALIGGGIGVYSLTFSFGTARTEGIVLKLEEGGEDHRQYRPVVGYQVDGATYIHVGRVWADRRTPTHKVGERVQVLYKVDQPQTALIDSFFERWFLPFVFGGVGMFFAGWGIVKLKRTRTPTEQPPEQQSEEEKP